MIYKRDFTTKESQSDVSGWVLKTGANMATEGPMMTRAALTQISTVTLIASLAFIKVGQQIINLPL